jgi:hypothetical protein
VKAVEVPGDYAVAPTLSDIRNHSFIFRSALARSGRDVIVNVGFGNRNLVGFCPPHTFIDLATNAVLAPFAVLRNSGINGGRLYSRDINKLW